MCYRATCPTCSKASWAGCGNHVSGAMDRIPVDEWCTCEPKYKFGEKMYPPKAGSHVDMIPKFLSGWFGGKKTEEKTEDKKEEQKEDL